MVVFHSLNLLNSLSEIEEKIKNHKLNLAGINSDIDLDEYLIQEINSLYGVG